MVALFKKNAKFTYRKRSLFTIISHHIWCGYVMNVLIKCLFERHYIIEVAGLFTCIYLN